MNNNFEVRKSETNPNDRKTKCSKISSFGFEVLDFLGLGFILAPVCFGFRYSDFGFILFVEQSKELNGSNICRG